MNSPSSACFAATLLSFSVIIPTNYLHHLSPWVSLVVALFGLGTLYLFRESCRERYHTKALYFLFLSVLILIWFPNGGSHGSVSYYLFHPIPVCSVTALCCSMMLWVLLRRYDHERDRLTGLNEELQRNMAQRAKAEKAMLQNRELLHAVIEGTTDAIYVKDAEGCYLLFNSAAAALTGKSAAQVLGRDDTDLFLPDEARRMMEIDRSILQCNVTRTVEQELTTANGKVKVLEATKGPLHDGKGNVAGIFGISRDVTESRRMAEDQGATIYFTLP